jgi:hypothetical protein
LVRIAAQWPSPEEPRGHKRQAGNHLSVGEHQDLQKCSGAGLALVKLKAAIAAFATAEARALSQLIEAFGRAKELGLSPADLDRALLAVNLGGGDANA